MGPRARSVPIWFRAFHSRRQEAKRLRSGSIQPRLLLRLENSAPRRATCSRTGHLADRFRSGKTFPLTERARLEFRSEFFNIFNHPQLGQPQSTFNPANTTGFGSIITTLN